MNENNNDKLQQYKDAFENIQKQQSACPSCGYCPHCGRSGHLVAPWITPMPYSPYPWYPSGPTWIVTTGTVTS